MMINGLAPNVYHKGSKNGTVARVSKKFPALEKINFQGRKIKFPALETSRSYVEVFR